MSDLGAARTEMRSRCFLASVAMITVDRYPCMYSLPEKVCGKHDVVAVPMDSMSFLLSTGLSIH